MLRSVMAASVCLALALTLCGCSSPDKAGDGDTNQDRFVGLELTGIEYDRFFDRLTGSYYAIFRDVDSGSISVVALTNIDGLPLAVDDANHGDLESTLKDIHENIERSESADD